MGCSAFWTERAWDNRLTFDEVRGRAEDDVEFLDFSVALQEEAWDAYRSVEIEIEMKMEGAGALVALGDEGPGPRETGPVTQYFMDYRVVGDDSVGLDDEHARGDRGRTEENAATFCNLELETWRARWNSKGHVAGALQQQHTAFL
jgi:hypothetical protein